MIGRCDFCGRSHGWKTLVGGNTGLLICDDCINLCILSLERRSIEERMEGLRNVMRDAIVFEEQKGVIDALTQEVSNLSQIVAAYRDWRETPPEPAPPQPIDDPHFGELDGD